MDSSTVDSTVNMQAGTPNLAFSLYDNDEAGTPRYMAPEFVKNQPYTSKIDVWALGVIFYEMCSGKVPFESEGIFDLYFQITNEEPTALSSKYSEELRILVN